MKQYLLWNIEALLSRASTQFLVWEGKLAHRRGDIHEFAHILACLAARSNECGDELENCELVDRSVETQELLDPMAEFEQLDLENWINEQ